MTVRGSVRWGTRSRWQKWTQTDRAARVEAERTIKRHSIAPTRKKIITKKKIVVKKRTHNRGAS